MAITTTPNLGFQLGDGNEVFDNDKFLRGNFQKIEDASANTPHLHMELKNATTYWVPNNVATGMVISYFDVIKNNGGWVPNTDKWSVPVSGVYNVTMTSCLNNSDASSFESQLHVFIYYANGGFLNSYQIGTNAHASGKFLYASGSINIYLSAGQQIAIVVKQDSSAGQNYVPPTRMTATLINRY